MLVKFMHVCVFSFISDTGCSKRIWSDRLHRCQSCCSLQFRRHVLNQGMRYVYK